MQSLTDWWTDLHDQQRLERLQQCHRLQEHLVACQAGRNSTPQQPLTTANNKAVMMEEGVGVVENRDIEHIVPGLRMMKYFGWRGIHKSTGGQNNEEDNAKIKNILNQTCAREQHAMWACRAVSIGCGSELVHLKHCFEEEGPLPVLTQTETMYEQQQQGSGGSGEKEGKKKIGKKQQRKIPCGTIQQQVGQCVHKGMKELYQREEIRKSKSNSSSDSNQPSSTPTQQQ